jgi:hypothetical protein
MPSIAGVARSIESDVDNLMRLISIANILPKGMYVENAVKVGGIVAILVTCAIASFVGAHSVVLCASVKLTCCISCLA